MRPLKDTEVARTKTGTPEELNMYADDVCGAGSVVRAVEELCAGRPVAWAVCERPPEDSGSRTMVRDVVRLAPMPGRACVRFVGTDGRPDGAHSSTVHGCGSMDVRGSVRDLDPVNMAARIAAMLARSGGWFFLLAE